MRQHLLPTYIILKINFSNVLLCYICKIYKQLSLVIYVPETKPIRNLQILLSYTEN